MCGLCCKELKAWCQSFTKTETFLSILEAVLLVVFIAFLTFVVLHFIACNKKEIDESTYPIDQGDQGNISCIPVTVAPGVECTWVPGEPTKAGTRYYEQTGTATSSPLLASSNDVPIKTPMPIVNDETPYLSDEDDAKSYEKHILALVKMRPPQDVTFGCILTIVSEYWAVTAASCIEAIEEVDSLDSFVMMEGYGSGRAGGSHAVSDVLVHPWYEGHNRSYDFVALKSEDKLVAGSGGSVEVSSLLDFFLAPIGEQLAIFGFGRYRGMDSGPAGRSLRREATFLLSAGQCAAAAAAAGDSWSPRHLRRPQPAPHAACSARALCAGSRTARGKACNYCAGTPLFLQGRLLGVMSDNPQCGVACEPVLYVNVPMLKPWLDALLAGDEDFLA